MKWLRVNSWGVLIGGVLFVAALSILAYSLYQDQEKLPKEIFWLREGIRWMFVVALLVGLGAVLWKEHSKSTTGVIAFAVYCAGLAVCFAFIGKLVPRLEVSSDGTVRLWWQQALDKATNDAILSIQKEAESQKTLIRDMRDNLTGQGVLVSSVIGTATQTSVDAQQLKADVAAVRGDLRRFEPLLSMVDKPSGGRRMCLLKVQMGLSTALASLYVPANWTVRQCFEMGRQIGSDGIQVGCIFENGESSFGERLVTQSLSEGTASVLLPKRNCGWSMR